MKDLLSISDPKGCATLLDLARDMEQRGEVPAVRFHRDPAGEIIGLMLCQIDEPPEGENR